MTWELPTIIILSTALVVVCVKWRRAAIDRDFKHDMWQRVLNRESATNDRLEAAMQGWEQANWRIYAIKAERDHANRRIASLKGVITKMKRAQG